MSADEGYTKTDAIAAVLMEADMALTEAKDLRDRDDVSPGVRSQAEAFYHNAPSLYGYDRDRERIFMTLDIAVSCIQADPTFAGGYALAAACIYRLGVESEDHYDERALEAALPWALKATIVDMKDPIGWEILSEIHCFMRDWDLASNTLGLIYRTFGDGDLYARATFRFFRLKGEVDQALNWGALAWQQEFNSQRLVQTLFALGHLYRDVSKWEKALDTYRVITEKDHDNAWAYHWWAYCAFQLEQSAEARELNQKAIELSKGQVGKFVEFQSQLGGVRTTSRRRRTNVPTNLPVGKPKTKTVPAPGARQIKAPKPITKTVSPPPVAAPKQVPAPKVVPPPPAKRPSTRRVAAPPPAKAPAPKTVQPPPPAKPSTRQVPAPPSVGKEKPKTRPRLPNKRKRR